MSSKLQDHPFFVWVGVFFALSSMISVIYACVQIVWYLDKQEAAIIADAEMQASWYDDDQKQYETQNEFIDDIRQKQADITKELATQTQQLHDLQKALSDATLKADAGRQSIDDGLRVVILELGDLRYELGKHQGHHDVLDATER